MTLSELFDAFDATYKVECAKRNTGGIDIPRKLKALWVSQALQDLQRQVKEFQKYTDVTLVVNTYEYTLPTDFGYPVAVEVVGQGNLDPASLEELEASFQANATTIDVPPSGASATQYAIRTDGTNRYIRFNGTPVANPRVWYYKSSLLYSPSGGSSQTWGTFDGSTASGALILTDDYVPAIIDFLLSRVFDDRLPIYEMGVQKLKQNRTVTVMDSFPYSMG